jgi:hypothetical protein
MSLNFQVEVSFSRLCSQCSFVLALPATSYNPAPRVFVWHGMLQTNTPIINPASTQQVFPTLNPCSFITFSAITITTSPPLPPHTPPLPGALSHPRAQEAASTLAVGVIGDKPGVQPDVQIEGEAPHTHHTRGFM